MLLKSACILYLLDGMFPLHRVQFISDVVKLCSFLTDFNLVSLSIYERIFKYPSRVILGSTFDTHYGIGALTFTVTCLQLLYLPGELIAMLICNGFFISPSFEVCFIRYQDGYTRLLSPSACLIH